MVLLSRNSKVVRWYRQHHGRATHHREAQNHDKAIRTDPSTGLDYIESSVKSALGDIQWASTHRLAGNEPVIEFMESLPESLAIMTYFPNKPVAQLGARSLLDITLTGLIQEPRDITFNMLTILPIHVVRRLWNLLNREMPTSFQIWKAFSQRLKIEDSEVPLSACRFRQSITSPNSPLHVYTRELLSPNFEFIASLSINVNFSILELVRLADLKNLGSLSIINPSQGCASSVSDRLIQTWSSAAVSRGAFSTLRILRLWYHEEVTAESLRFIDKFPSLAIYNVYGCKFDKTANAVAKGLGWEMTLESDLVGSLKDACIQRVTRILDRRNSVGYDRMRRRQPRRLSDTATAKKMSREAAHKHVLNADRESNRRAHALISNPPSRPLPENGKRISGTYDPIKLSRFDSWDDDNYEIFARIGELRADKDLLIAGVDIGEAIVVDTELVPLIPTAALQLGFDQRNTSGLKDYISWPIPPHPNPSRLPMTRPYSGSQTTVFTRIKIPKKPASDLIDLKRPASGHRSIKKKFKLEEFLGTF